MKARLLTLFSLLALLLVSTAALADGRPTGIRIGRAVSNDTNVEIDITVTDTDRYRGVFSTTVLIGNRVPWGDEAWQYASSDFSVPLPWAIEWGDGYYIGPVPLFGPPGGPFTATFSHTYASPGTYTIVAGDRVCCSTGTPFPSPPLTGNPIYGVRYMHATFGDDTFTNPSTSMLAITNTAVVTTGTGIPTTNTYGLIALALLLVGSGLLLYRKPQRT